MLFSGISVDFCFMSSMSFLKLSPSTFMTSFSDIRVFLLFLKKKKKKKKKKILLRSLPLLLACVDQVYNDLNFWKLYSQISIEKDTGAFAPIYKSKTLYLIFKHKLGNHI